MGDKRWVTSNFELQNICAEIGLQPVLEEIEKALTNNDHRIDFEGLLRFITYMKTKFYAPEPPDMDTVRAFVAVGGSVDKSGNVEAEVLLQTCQRFNLNIELDGLLGDDNPNSSIDSIDNSNSSIEFNQFSTMLQNPDIPKPSGGRLQLGYDYQTLLAKEMREKGLPIPRVRRPTDILTRTNTVGAQHRRSWVRRASQMDGARRMSKAVVEKQRYYTELKAKGISPMLYGVEDDTPNVTSVDGGKKSDISPNNRTGDNDGEISQVEGSTRKKRKTQMPKAPKSSPQTILGVGTRVIGRSGLFVDDPPKLYPQHLAATNIPILPPIRCVSPLHSTRRPMTKHSENIILASIEKRIADHSKKKLGAKYHTVQSRVNISGSPMSTQQLE